MLSIFLSLVSVFRVDVATFPVFVTSTDFSAVLLIDVSTVLVEDFSIVSLGVCVALGSDGSTMDVSAVFGIGESIDLFGLARSTDPEIDCLIAPDTTFS